MKTKLILSSIFLTASLTGFAQEVMNLNLNNGSNVKYNVDEIKEITFEETSTSVEPPVPTAKILVSRINDITFTYDSSGRCTMIYYEDEEIGYGFDYSSGRVTCMGFNVGNFTMNSNGYLDTFVIDFFGAYSKMTMAYDADGYLSKVKIDSIDEDGPYSIEDNMTWNEGLLMQIQEWQKDEEGLEEYLQTFTYSDKKNELSQFTMGMMNDEDLPLQVIGFFGKPPVKFPSASKWNTDALKKINYTFNSDGTVKTETIGGHDYDYQYKNRMAKPADSDTLSRHISRLLSSRRK